MSLEIMATLTEIKVSVAKIETRQETIIEQILHNKREVRDHVSKDESSFKAIGIELTNIDNKIDSNHNWVKSIILPACGGCVVIGSLLTWVFK